MKGSGVRESAAPDQTETAGPGQAETTIGSTLQRVRMQKRMSLRTFAARAGFSPSFISQVENGLVSPSIASLERIARVLGLGLADFFQQSSSKAGLITREADRRRLNSQWSRAQVEPLVPPEALRWLEGWHW